MSDLRDFTGKNRKFTGAAGIKVSDDGLGDGDRVNEKGRIRFNDSTDLMEYYTGTDWKSIDSPPSITQFTLDGGSDVTSAVIDPTESGNATIQVKGSLFDTTGATVTFVGTSETLSTASITRNSANLLTVTVLRSQFDNTNEPYAIKVTNASGLSAELADAILADQAPAFTNAADTTFVVNDANRSGYSADCGATDPDSDTITYSVSAGSLPTGASLNTSTGAVTGADAVGSNTTSTFTISAATTAATATRQFSIQVLAPVSQNYTSSTTLTVPTGSTYGSVQAWVVGGGGGGAGGTQGDMGFCGGGGGGLAKHTGLTLTAATYPITVGAGGSGRAGEGQPGSGGTASSFHTLTANAGAGGPTGAGQPGGAGGTGSGGTTNGTGGAGGASNPTGQSGGNPGEAGGNGTNGAAGGGGGGNDASSNGQVNGGVGGQGTSSNYTGGGGGGGNDGDGTPITAPQRGIAGTGLFAGGNGGGQSQPAGQPGGGPSGGPGGSPTGTRNNSGGGGGSYGGGGGGAGSGDGGQVGGGHGAGGLVRLVY